MLDKLGKRALAAPIGIALVLCCVLSLALAPMLRAEPHGVPFAVVNLDTGATFAAGDASIGQTLADGLVSGDVSLGGSSDDAQGGSQDASTIDMASAISWVQLDSEDELADALADNSLCGGVVIPENFTSQQMGATVGLNAAPEITVYLNVAKNPQLATTMQTTIAQAMLEAGVAVNVEMVNNADVGGGSMASMMAVQMVVMPMFMMLMFCSILTVFLAWRMDVTGMRGQGKAARLSGVLLAIVAAFSAVIALLVLFIDCVAGGLALPVGEMFAWLWLSGLCVMLCFVGLCTLSMPLGVVVAVAVFSLGMGTAMLAPEMLPAFWADFVCPWAPQAHIGQGVRTIVYLGQMPAFADVVPLAAFGIVGVGALLAAGVRESRRARTAKAN